MINARSETVAVKPFFRDAFKKRRCLVPATGFYEWAKDGGEKRPIYFFRKDRAPFAIAGLWESRPSAETGVESFCLLTSAANSFMKPYHHRMPVVLDAEHFEAWLDPSTDFTSLDSLLAPRPWDDMSAYPVSRRVNDPTNDDPSCIEADAAGER